MPQLPMGDISAADVIWDYDGVSERSLSPHYGSVNLSMDETINPVEEEDFGDAPVDAVRGGATMILTVPMTRSNLLQLEAALKGTKSGSSVSLENRAGQAMRENAKEMVVRPRREGAGDADESTWIVLFHCSPRRAFELAYDRSTQKIFNVEFTVFVSQVSGQIGKFGTIGKT